MEGGLAIALARQQLKTLHAKSVAGWYAGEDVQLEGRTGLVVGLAFRLKADASRASGAGRKEFLTRGSHNDISPDTI